MVSNNATNTARRVRTAGPLRLAFTRAVHDWYYGLIPFAAINFMWVLAVLTVVAGPPATAALLAVARDGAIGYGAEPKNFFLYVRQFFWRAWRLGLVTFLGSVILVTDLRFYADALRGNPFVLNMGVLFLLYVLVVWLELLLIAWPVLVNQPQMSIRDVLRNAGVVVLRTPGASFGLALLVFLVFLLSFSLAVTLALAFGAFVALLAQHYLYLQAPVLANFPPLVGEGAVDPETED